MEKINLTKTPAQLFSKRLTHIKFSQLIVEDLNKIVEVNKKNLKESYLLNSYIINLIASWQVFIEELAKFAVDKVVKGNDNAILNKIIQNNFEEKISKFNTPNIQNINTLFKNLLDLEKITQVLEDKAKNNINATLDIRHVIAHKGYSLVELSISDNFKRMEMLMESAIKLENAVISHVKK